MKILVFLIKKWRVIDPWIDLKNFTFQTKKESPPTFIYVGSLRAYKGVWTVVEAFVRLKKECCLHLIGDHEPLFKKEIEEYFKQHDCVGSVQWSGKMTASQLRQEYASATAIVFPSVCEEAFGLVWVEGMAAGVPVIVSDHSGVANHQQKSVTVFKAGDVDSLQEALTQNLVADNVSEKVLQDSSQYAHATFSVQKATHDILAMYQKLIEERSLCCD